MLHSRPATLKSIFLHCNKRQPGKRVNHIQFLYFEVNTLRVVLGRSGLVHVKCVSFSTTHSTTQVLFSIYSSVIIYKSSSNCWASFAKVLEVCFFESPRPSIAAKTADSSFLKNQDETKNIFCIIIVL